MESYEEAIERWFQELFKDYPQERHITLHTGAGGMDMIDGEFEKRAGFKRVYIGRKVLRILRTSKHPIKKSYRGIYYKLIGDGQVFQDRGRGEG